MKTDPRFTEALEQYQAFRQAGREDTPAARAVWDVIWRYAPPEFMALARQVAREMDLIPPPCGYDAEGNPVYRLDDVAGRLGVDVAEAEAFVRERTELQSPPPVHRIN